MSEEDNILEAANKDEMQSKIASSKENTDVDASDTEGTDQHATNKVPDVSNGEDNDRNATAEENVDLNATKKASTDLNATTDDTKLDAVEAKDADLETIEAKNDVLDATEKEEIDVDTTETEDTGTDATETEDTGTDATETEDTGTEASETEGTETETDETRSSGTYESTSGESSSSYSTYSSSPSKSTSTVCSDEEQPTNLLPQNVIALKDRHIRAEDFEWAICPVPALAQIIVKAADIIEGSDLEDFLKHVNPDQKLTIYEKLSLDLPLNITLTLIDEGKYWKRMCLQQWKACDIWRYADNWKSMFVHRTVQKLIENFTPLKSNFQELVEDLKMFSPYVNSLEIKTLQNITEKNLVIDLSLENFDEELDEYIALPQGAIYLDFEKVIDCFIHLKELIIIISPRCLDNENFHLNVADFNSLFRGLCKLKELQRIRISNGSLSNEQIRIVARMFLPHSCLTVLNLSYNFIDDSVCDYIGKLLMSDCPLETLILKYNRIVDEGAKSIAAALSKNSKLKKLDLSLNMIGDEGGSFLARVLARNSSIVDLDVSKNKMLSKVGADFAKLIKTSSSLRSLHIQENLLGEVCGKMFSSALKNNRSILDLDVHFCGFSNEDVGLIHEYLIINRAKIDYYSYISDKKNITASEYVF